MAIYHLSAKPISRATGRSATGAAAYRAGEKITDERTGLVFDYTRKQGVDHTEIMAPNDAPGWAHDRAKLWNAVEHSEKRRDSQVAREIEVALPIELSLDQQRELLREFVKSQFVSEGMVADFAIHHSNGNNPHCHIMLTTRDIGPEGFGQKNRDWNSKDLLEQWREKWAEHSNRALESAGFEARIDHRSLEEQGITDRAPSTHLGPAATGIIRRDESSAIVERAKQQADEFMARVQAGAAILAAAERDIKELEGQLEKLRAEIEQSEQGQDLANVSVCKLQELENMDQVEELDYVQSKHADPLEKIQRLKKEISVFEELHLAGPLAVRNTAMEARSKAHRRELVESAHGAFTRATREHKRVSHVIKNAVDGMDGLPFWRPLKKLQLKKELEDARKLLADQVAAKEKNRDMAHRPIAEKCDAAIKAADGEIEAAQVGLELLLRELEKLEQQAAEQQTAREAEAGRLAEEIKRRMEADRAKEHELRVAELRASPAHLAELKARRKAAEVASRSHDSGPAPGR